MFYQSQLDSIDFNQTAPFFKISNIDPFTKEAERRRGEYLIFFWFSFAHPLTLLNVGSIFDKKRGDGNVAIEKTEEQLLELGLIAVSLLMGSNANLVMLSARTAP